MKSMKNGLAPGMTVAIVDTQWGDTGKGKVVDVFAEWADIIARGTGGANAGHTIVLNGKTHTFHLIPSGILHDRDGKINVIGNGVAFDPRIVCEELALLRAEGCSYDRLKIAYNAKLVLPQHLVMDRVREALAGAGKIGTTGRGIGPVYMDHVARLGLTVADMFNVDTFATKLRRNLKEKVTMLQGVDPEVVKEIMRHEHLEKGIFYDPKTVFDIDAVVNQYFRYADQLRELVCDADELLRKAVGKQNVLLEGAQGVLLSVDCGIQPYVTSSDCSLAGLAKGIGLSERHVNRVFSIAKAFYMTRVGEGPFPTELGGTESAKWCGTAGITAKTEQEQYPNASVNGFDPLEQGIGIRVAGNEYGATTGRPRRTGWLDLPLLRYAMQYASRELILTKVDVLDQCREINICVAYEYCGHPYRMGSETITQGQVLEMAVPISEIIANVRPIYKQFPGWMQSIGDIREWENLPEKLRDIVSFLEKEAEAKVAAVSVGPDREQIVAA